MKILAVVVRYKVPLCESQTVVSLSRAITQDSGLEDSVKILIWDNSPEPIDYLEQSFPIPVIYRHTGINAGLSGAFNHAAAIAHSEEIPWLLLLDQDTVLPEDFLSGMLRHVSSVNSRSEIAAIVPTVYVGDFVVSPRRMLFNRHRAYPGGEIGIAEGEAAAINSGTLLRVSDLLEIGGYSEEFWLDYSDWYVFHQFYLRKKQVWRAADIQLQHSMTVMDYDNLMSIDRYRNLLAAEEAFNDLYKGRIENGAQTLRLAARVLKQRLKFKNSEFSRITWEHLLWRLFTSRSQRIRRWQELAVTTKGTR